MNVLELIHNKFQQLCYNLDEVEQIYAHMVTYIEACFDLGVLTEDKKTYVMEKLNTWANPFGGLKP